MGDLQRFITAQDGQRGDCTLYELALKEIQEGKLGFECWIRYVYPQQSSYLQIIVYQFVSIKTVEK